MRYSVLISVSEVLSECIAQTSVDFSGLRAANPQTADAAYGDFVLSSDLRPEVMTQLEVALAVLEKSLGNALVISSFDSEGISIVLRTENPVANCHLLKVYVKEYLKGAVLTWWYGSRNADLQARNNAASLVALQELSAVSTTLLRDRRLRYF